MAYRPRRQDRSVAGDWRSHYELIWKPRPMTPATAPTDGMTLAQFVAARAVLRDALAQFRDPVCHNCKHFSMGACAQFGEVPEEFQREPERCEAWVWDAIPF